MNALAQAIGKEVVKTTTTNGAVTFSTSTNYLVDFFFMGGASRNKSEQDLTELFDKSFSENPDLALKILFYIRDIRGGLGERKAFRTILKHLSLSKPTVASNLINKVAEFGRWDDLWCLLETPVKGKVIEVVKETSDQLLYKWLPSINTSSEQTVKYARIIAKGLGLNHKQYRQMLSSNRKVLETQLCNNQWEEVEYRKVPSKAMLQYRKAFYRHSEERFTEYVESVTKGEAKINTGTLYPYDIFNKVMSGGEDKALDVLWNNLPNYITEGSGDSLVIADVSGSMEGQPMSVSVSLALYMAERNKGAFKNIFMSFHESPSFHYVTGTTVQEKMRNILKTPWGMGTNLELVFTRLLETAKKSNVPKEDMPKVLYIISDMEFNSATRADKTLFEAMQQKFSEAEYEMPLVVFWNVDSKKNNVPVFSDEKGVYLVSGCSPVVFKSVASMDFGTPYDYMLSVVDVPRYAEILLT